MAVPITSRQSVGGGVVNHTFKIEYSVVDDRANKSPIFVVKSLVYHHFIEAEIRPSSIFDTSKVTSVSPGHQTPTINRIT